MALPPCTLHLMHFNMPLCLEHGDMATGKRSFPQVPGAPPSPGVRRPPNGPQLSAHSKSSWPRASFAPPKACRTRTAAAGRRLGGTASKQCFKLSKPTLSRSCVSRSSMATVMEIVWAEVGPKYTLSR